MYEGHVLRPARQLLGIGIAFLNAQGRRDYLRWAPLAMLLLVVSFVLTFPVIPQTLNEPHPFQD